MKFFILISVFLFLGNGNIYSQYYPIDIKALIKSYEELSQEPESFEKQKAYFDAFPTSFTEYLMVFQYVPDPDHDNSLSEEVGNYLNSFGGLNKIPREIYCDKLLRLSVRGFWEADAANFLQALTRETVRENLVVFLKLMDEQYAFDQVRYSFWFFYFNSLHKISSTMDDYQKFKKIIEKSYPGQIRFFNLAFEAAYGNAVAWNRFPHYSNH